MDKKNIYSTLIRKEFLSLKRQKLLLVIALFIPLSVIGTSWFLSFGTIEDTNQIRYILEYQMITISLYTIPNISMILFSKTVIDERKEKTNNVLISVGIDSKTIWLTKVISIVGFSLVCFWLYIILYIVVGWLLFGVFISTNPIILIMACIVVPNFSISISLILCLLFWILKNTTVVSIFPTLFMFASYYLNMTCLDSVISIGEVLLMIGSTVLVLVVCLKIVNSISNEYITNL